MSVEMSLSYEGSLRSRVIHAPSMGSLKTDAPVDNHGQGESFSPTDLLAASLLSCAVTTMAIRAPSQGIDFAKAEGQVRKTMSKEGPRRVARLDVSIALPAALNASSRATLEDFAQSCPVALSLASSVETRFSFEYSL